MMSNGFFSANNLRGMLKSAANGVIVNSLVTSLITAGKMIFQHPQQELNEIIVRSSYLALIFSSVIVSLPQLWFILKGELRPTPPDQVPSQARGINPLVSIFSISMAQVFLNKLIMPFLRDNHFPPLVALGSGLAVLAVLSNQVRMEVNNSAINKFQKSLQQPTHQSSTQSSIFKPLSRLSAPVLPPALASTVSHHPMSKKGR
ncbi:hypothetical protein BH10PSE19_BH10PSE19_01130 [soil metagenome]